MFNRALFSKKKGIYQPFGNTSKHLFPHRDKSTILFYIFWGIWPNTPRCWPDGFLFHPAETISSCRGLSCQLRWHETSASLGFACAPDVAGLGAGVIPESVQRLDLARPPLCFKTLKIFFRSIARVIKVWESCISSVCLFFSFQSSVIHCKVESMAALTAGGGYLLIPDGQKCSSGSFHLNSHVVYLGFCKSRH